MSKRSAKVATPIMACIVSPLRVTDGSDRTLNATTALSSFQAFLNQNRFVLQGQHSTGAWTIAALIPQSNSPPGGEEEDQNPPPPGRRRSGEGMTVEN